MFPIVCRCLLPALFLFRVLPAQGETTPVPVAAGEEEASCSHHVRQETDTDAAVEGFFLYPVDALIVTAAQPAAMTPATATARPLPERIRLVCQRVIQRIRPGQGTRKPVRDAGRTAYNQADTSLHPLVPAMQAERVLRAARLAQIGTLAGADGVLPVPVDLPGGLGRTVFVNRAALGAPIVQGTLVDGQGNLRFQAERERIRQARANAMGDLLHWMRTTPDNLEPSVLARMLDGRDAAGGWIATALSLNENGVEETVAGTSRTPPLARSPSVRWYVNDYVNRRFTRLNLANRFGPFDVAGFHEAMHWYDNLVGPQVDIVPETREIRDGTLRRLVRTDDDPLMRSERVGGQDRLVYERTDLMGRRRLYNYNRALYAVADYLQTNRAIALQYMRFHLQQQVFRDELRDRIRALQDEIRQGKTGDPGFRVRMLMVPAITPLPQRIHRATRTQDTERGHYRDLWGFVPVIETLLVVERDEARMYVTNPLVPNLPEEGLFDALGRPRAVDTDVRALEAIIRDLEVIEAEKRSRAPGQPALLPGTWNMRALNARIAARLALLDPGGRQVVPGRRDYLREVYQVPVPARTDGLRGTGNAYTGELRRRPTGTAGPLGVHGPIPRLQPPEAGSSGSNATRRPLPTTPAPGEADATTAGHVHEETR